MPVPSEATPTLKDYNATTPKGGYWTNRPKFFVSLLKAFWGEAATPANDFAYDYLPKVGKGYQGSGYSWIPLFESMGEGRHQGLVDLGHEPGGELPQLVPGLCRPGQARMAGGL